VEETYFLGKKEDAMQYSDQINVAGYYKVPIAIAENKFQEQVFTNTETFHHISELETAMAIVRLFHLLGLKTQKNEELSM